MDPRIQRSARVLGMIVPAIVVGLLIGAQLRTQGGRTVATARYLVPLTESAAALQREQAELKAQLAQLRAELVDIQRGAAAVDGRIAAIQDELADLRGAAGLTPLAGPGVAVTLDDGHIPASSPVSTIELAIVHSNDITDVLNAAWEAGATAASINGERITGTSACVGAVIQVNGALLSPPFVIWILGPSDALLRALTASGELSDLRRRRDLVGLGFHVERSDRLLIPGYTGPISVRYAVVR